jgi:hypothetical protein
MRHFHGRCLGLCHFSAVSKCREAGGSLKGPTVVTGCVGSRPCRTSFVRTCRSHAMNRLTVEGDRALSRPECSRSTLARSRSIG